VTDPDEIVFYVAGINGSTGNLGATPKAAKLGTGCTAFGDFRVPNGTLWTRENATVTGRLTGRDVIVGQNVTVRRDP
jgi:hypothetical protein